MPFDRLAAARLPHAALLWLLMTFPLLAFPEAVWPTGRWLVVALSIADLALAVILLRDRRELAIAVGVLGVTLLAGWGQVSYRENALSHLAGASAGLLAMAVVGACCGTQFRLALAGAVFVTMGLAVLVVGLGSAAIPAPTKYLPWLTQHLPQIPLGLPRLESGGLVNPNALGGTALLIMTVAAAFAKVPGGVMPAASVLRIAAALTAFWAFAVVVITQSRATWVAVWIVGSVAVMTARRLRNWRWTVTAVLLVMPVGGIFLIKDRIDPTVVGAADRLLARTAIWYAGIQEFRGSPLIGIGLNEFRYRAAESPGGPSDIAHAHNTFLQTALDLGLAGFVAYVAVLTILAGAANRARRLGSRLSGRVATGAALALIGVHVFGMVDAIALGAKVGLFQWLAAGLILAASRIPAAASAGSDTILGIQT